MLIQKLAPCDSIVAPEQPPADFCNNIGPQQKHLNTLNISAYWGLAEILGFSWHTAPKRIVTGPQMAALA
jgi:hypothetical protein